MLIVVTRSGGLTGKPKTAELDTAGRDDAAEWEDLARQVLAAGSDTPATPIPDGYVYRIAVDGRTVECADPNLTPEQRRLITGVLQSAQ
ncbi:protealysin inhibitor emfourin [Nocardia sp. NPDC003482]